VPVLILDAGKSLIRNGQSLLNDHNSFKAREISKAYVAMGYHGVAIAGRDLEDGGKFIQETLASGMPWVSANVSSSDPTIDIPSYRIVELGTLKVAITAVTDSLNIDTVLSVVPYRDALVPLLSELSVQYDILIVLSNLKGKENIELASLFPEIDILLSSDRTQGKMSPVVIGKTLMTQTSSRGKYLGLLNIEWNDGEAWHNSRPPSISELTSRRDRITKAIEEIKKEGKGGKRLTRLELQKTRLSRDIEKRVAVEGANTGKVYNKQKLRFFPVHPSKTPKDIESIVQSIEESRKK